MQALIDSSEKVYQLAGHVLFAALSQNGPVGGGMDRRCDATNTKIRKYNTATRAKGDHPWPCGNRLRAVPDYHCRALHDFVQLDKTCLPDSEADIAKVWAIVSVEAVSGSHWEGIIASPFTKIGRGGPCGKIPHYKFETGVFSMIPLDQIKDIVDLVPDWSNKEGKLYFLNPWIHAWK